MPRTFDYGLGLNLTALGAIGFRLFHHDQQTSFGVNSQGNPWICSVGCGGGNIVSFRMKFKNCNYATTLKELEELPNGHTT